MSNIVKNLTTTGERRQLIEFLDRLMSSIFDPSLNFNDFINSGPEKFRLDLIDYFSEDLAHFEAEKCFSKCKTLKEELTDVSKTILTLAIEADMNTNDMVRSSLNEHEDKPVIVDFVKDPNLIGGCVIENNGRIFELSFRDYFEKRKRGKNGL